MGATRHTLGPHVRRELDLARLAALGGAWADAWRFLERAHILSQPSATLHTRVHCSMLGVALRQRDVHEVLGQLVRVVLAPVGSILGRYPRGNTGRSNVSMFEPMALPTDLEATLVRATRPPEA